VPRNIDRLKKNLTGFEKRYELKECAVGVEDGKFDFALDDTGRYGGLIKGGASHFSQWDPQKIVSVDVVSANQYLVKILNLHKSVDILKIDVEGYENKILSNLKMESLSRIDCIYAETADNQEIPGFYSRSNSGLTAYYRNQSI
jgi:FkbM family methyltransferase